MKPAHAIILFAVTTLLPGRAQAWPQLPPEAGQRYFETHIRPLFARHCYACHSARDGKREGGLTLDHPAGWRVGGESGAAIISGDIDGSRLIQAVRYRDGLEMPPSRQLSETAIERLEEWVRIGAPAPANAPARSDDFVDPADPVAGREHWAFQPLRSGAPRLTSTEPFPVHQTWNRIDEFIIDRLHSEGLVPAESANRRDLLRRATFQLTGLPPSTEAIVEFLSDERPDAFERQTDRLLASPHYGERWGRHWLDLARYADSNGLDENFLFREAWRYRNRVVDTINADMPFDRFLTEQIAGDLLPFNSTAQRDRQRISAGFLVVGPKVLLGNNPDERIMDVADEQLDTIGRTVLGMTLGCARCHDHKFDPIPTADYYALAGIFTSTTVMETRFMLNQQRNMERLVGLGPEGDAANEAYETFYRERAKLQQQLKDANAVFVAIKNGDSESLAKFAEKQPSVIADTADETSRPQKQRLAAQQQLITRLKKSLTNPPAIPPRAMIPADIDQPADEAIRIAGQFDKRGETVRRGFLQVLDSEPNPIPDHQSGRLELARWLTDSEYGAGHLAARVLANRVWHHLIGRGLVRTVDNFGRMGEPPSHPELLDDLANDLLRSDWSIKFLVRRVVQSHTFAQSSEFESTGNAIDPDNRLLWRAHRRRLDPESLRDAMLQAAGTLDTARLDSSVDYLGDQATAVGANKNRRRTDFPNRSLYLPVIRNDLPELFEAFDFADPHTTTGMRPETLVAMQGLFLLNDETVIQAARSTAQRVLDTTTDTNSRIRTMYELVLNAEVDSAERDDMDEFIRSIASEFESTPAEGSDHELPAQEDVELRAWSVACQALFASSRFQTLE